MQSSTTFAVLFWVYTQRADKNNESNIYVRITVNQKKVNLSINQKAKISLWDSRRQRIKGNSSQARTINLYLDQVKSEIVQCYRDLASENKVLSAKLVKARFLGEDKRIRSLKDIFKYHNDKMGVKLAPKTLCHYETSQKYILEYVLSEYKNDDVFLQDLDYQFILGLESFLRSYQPKHYQGKIGNNAVMKHIQRLRRMVTLAFHMEWIERDPFVKFKPRLEKREREFLTEDELQRIMDISTSIERLSNVRDLFIFSCYTWYILWGYYGLNKKMYCYRNRWRSMVNGK